MAIEENNKRYGYKILKEIWEAYQRGTSPSEIARQYGRTSSAINTTIWKFKKLRHLKGEELTTFVNQYGVNNNFLKVIVDSGQGNEITAPEA